jgi:hypothetical protein
MPPSFCRNCFEISPLDSNLQSSLRHFFERLTVGTVAAYLRGMRLLSLLALSIVAIGHEMGEGDDGTRGIAFLA